MHRSLKELTGYTLEAEDGEIGCCDDFLLDDQSWAVRYMVADTRKWLPGRKVLISPISLGEPDWAGHTIRVRLTKEQIKNQPELDEHAPVSRQYEIWYHKHFGWPYYWSGTGLWASGIDPRELYVDPALQRNLEEAKEDAGPDLDHPHLHAAKEIIGYDVQAVDGELGHVLDFIIDDELWVVDYAALATRNWLPGKKVIIPLKALTEVSWDDRALVVNLTREAIKESPEYDPHLPVNREFEERIYDFVGRPHDWR
jgi:hypothetical protein